MKSKHLDITCNNHCKAAGGLFFGIRIHFPVSTYDYVFDEQHTCITATLGLLCISITFDLKYNYK